MEMGDNPDWTLPVSVRAQEIASLAVDIAAQSLSELTIKIAGQEVPVTIEPAGGVVFNVQGSVDANITNSSLNVNAYVTNSKLNVDANITNSQLDVNVTNSSLDVNVQGTANVEIQNAQLNVQTLREQASEAGKLDYAWTVLDLENYEEDEKWIYENTGNTTVYLEAVFAAQGGSGTYDPSCNVEIGIYSDSGSAVAFLDGNLPNFPLNLDPAIPIPPGYKVSAYAQRWSSNQYKVRVTLLLRTE